MNSRHWTNPAGSGLGWHTLTTSQHRWRVPQTGCLLFGLPSSLGKGANLPTPKKKRKQKTASCCAAFGGISPFRSCNHSPPASASPLEPRSFGVPAQNPRAIPGMPCASPEGRGKLRKYPKQHTVMRVSTGSRQKSVSAGTRNTKDFQIQAETVRRLEDGRLTLGIPG